MLGLVQVTAASSLMSLLAFTINAGNVNPTYIAMADSITTDQLNIVSQNGLVPHPVTRSAMALLGASSTARQRFTQEPTTRRMLLQENTQLANFEHTSKQLDLAAREELTKGAAVGVQREGTFGDLSVSYANLLPSTLQEKGAMCGSFQIPAGTRGPEAAVYQCTAKRYPVSVLDLLPGSQDIVTGIHQLTIYAANATASLELNGAQIRTTMSRITSLPQNIDMRSFCLALSDTSKWARRNTSGVGETPAQSYSCTLDRPGVAAVEDNLIVRIPKKSAHTKERDLEWLFLVLLLLLILLLLIIIALIAHHRWQAIRLARHKQRMKNAELGALLIPEPIGVGDAKISVAANVRTAPDMLQFEEPL
jgi:hypothetical protein